MTPQVVRARTSRDYATKPSPLVTARRKEREAVGRVGTLRRKLLTMERENARLRRDTAVSEAEHIAERIREGEDRRRLSDEVDRLSRQMFELRADVERRDIELRTYVDTALAEQVTHVEQRATEVAWAMIERFASSTIYGSVEQVAEVEAPVAAVSDTDMPVEASDPRGVRGTRDGRARGLAAMAEVRVVPRNKQLREERTEPPITPPDALGQLGSFFRQRPPKR